MVPPHELKTKEFTRGIRGYNTQEVDAQIEYLTQSYTELYRHAAEIEKAYAELYKKYKEATADREAVKSDLIDVRLASDQIIADANEKAEMIVRASKTNCDYIINDYRRTVSEEREKLIKIQATIQQFKDTLLNECREYMDKIDEMTEIADTSLYYSTDDELTARVLDEIKTDVRYAMVEKESQKSISDDEIAVDMDCFTEASPEDGENASLPDSTRTDIYSPEPLEIKGSARLDETIQFNGKITDAYKEFAESIDPDNK